MESALGFLFVFTQVLDDTAATARFARNTGITAMQDQPVVGILFEFLRYQSLQTVFDFQYVLAGSYAGAVGYPENMRIHGDGRLTERRVKDDIGCFPTHPG
jgi:hypothetical protein